MFKKQIRLTATVSLLAVALAVSLSSPAIADASSDQPSNAKVNGPLDPATFSGTMIVATVDGDVAVTVEKGEAASVANKIQADAVKGKVPPTTDAQCNAPSNSYAPPTGYSTSVQGCAVFGYRGYTRYYNWTNNTDGSTICTKGNGYNSSGNQFWYSTGCKAAGASGSVVVPWGNVLAYTQMQGYAPGGSGFYTWIA